MAGSRVRVWMDVMRHLEPVVDDHERLFDAWEAGGVDGIVVGPMSFEEGVATFDPDPSIYRSVGVEVPGPPTSALTEKRRTLEQALNAAKKRGWQVWIFQPGSGALMGPEAGPLIVDERSQAAWSARIADTMQHYPMADGAVLDGPEWGYEISPHHVSRSIPRRSYIFDDLPESIAPACARLGFDYRSLVAASDRLYRRLHALRDRDVQMHGGGSGGLFGAFGLLGGDPSLFEWIAFRVESLTHCYASIRETSANLCRHEFRMAAGPRTAAFAPLCGYDLPRLATILDVLLPKLYFWHRGFDGMYGTVARYVETLTRWNPDLSEASALAVVSALFGLVLPGIASLPDFDDGFPPEFFEKIVAQETARALAAIGDPNRMVPWIDAGRKPHDGDPITAGDLGRILDAAAGAGMRRFIYHHHANLTPGEWATITRRCGTPWQSAVGPSPDDDGYYPPDEPVL